MSDDPSRDWLESELRWFRYQDGEFDARLVQSQGLIDAIGGGSVRETRRAIERLIRANASDPDGDVMAYFYTAGYRTGGESLNKRLDTYAKRHFVSKRTALRRSDNGATIVAGLLRDDFKNDRPWAHLVAVQRGASLTVRLAFVVEQGTDFVPPAIRINGERFEYDVPDPEVEHEVRDRDRYWINLPLIALNLDVPPDNPLAEVLLAWVPKVAPSWELVAHLDSDQLYARLTIEPFPFVMLRIGRWSSPTNADESAQD